LGSYVNAGGTALKHFGDFNNDGKTELFFLNYFNPLHCTSLAVFDADSVIGASPPITDTCISKVAGYASSALCFVLFPTSDLGQKDVADGRSQPYKNGIIQSGDGLINAYLSESNASPDACLIFSLDNRFRVTHITPSEQYVKRRGELIAGGRLENIDLGDLLNRLRDSVKYWTDSGLVTEAQLRADGK
jgi:hypothetical protein